MKVGDVIAYNCGPGDITYGVILKMHGDRLVFRDFSIDTDIEAPVRAVWQSDFCQTLQVNMRGPDDYGVWKRLSSKGRE